MFYVKALDTCEFTITLLGEENEFIELKDSQAFVYLFDDLEDNLVFKFVRERKVDVNFNLIAPLHSLDLIVENGDKLPDDEDALISAEGFLSFKADDAPKDDFIIMVRKR